MTRSWTRDARRFDDAFAALDAFLWRKCHRRIRACPACWAIMRAWQDGDALLFANFRADRAREISTALLDPGFDGFKRARVVKFAAAAGLTEYSDALKPFMAAIFPPEDVRETLGRSDRRTSHEPAAHRRNREIRPCHLLPEWRARRPVRRRGPHPGAQPQGRHLRPQAGDERLSGDRQAGRSHRHRGKYDLIVVQLCQSRHGGAYGCHGGRGQGGGYDRRMPGQACAPRWKRRAA